VAGDLLDLILVALAAAFAVAGYRQGFIVGVLSFVGFLGGAAIGAVFSPSIARTFVSSQNQQALVAIVVVFIAAMLGQLGASLAGAAVRSRVTWRPAALVDAAGGAAVSVLSVLLIAWFIGSAVINAPFPAVAKQVNQSLVLRTVDRIMPGATRSMFSHFRQLLASGPYTQVFGSLGAEQALDVAAPNPKVLRSQALKLDKPSIVKIIGTSPGCNHRLEGSGFVISRDHVLTNAHVVAGVTQGPEVLQQGHAFAAHVVLFDPQRDVAVLYVPGLVARPLHFKAHAHRGASAIVAGYPLDQNFTAVPARVGSASPATAPNIYQTNMVTREIYSIKALVRPGNSGGPLLAPNGAVYGVVFAAAVGVGENDVGYALTAGEVGADVRAGEGATASVSTQPWHCD
jgi:S1-C subfamily serine protease